MKETLKQTFGNRIRIRCCGILIRNKKLLLINHSNLTKSNSFWIPPGGGLEEFETVEACLKREFLEETGLKIEVESYIGLVESLHSPFHAIELFFFVTSTNSSIKKGIDPELSIEKQLIKDVNWLSKAELLRLKEEDKHPFLKNIEY